MFIGFAFLFNNKAYFHTNGQSHRRRPQRLLSGKMKAPTAMKTEPGSLYPGSSTHAAFLISKRGLYKTDHCHHPQSNAEPLHVLPEIAVVQFLRHLHNLAGVVGAYPQGRPPVWTKAWSCKAAWPVRRQSPAPPLFACAFCRSLEISVELFLGLKQGSSLP